jgi:hypothetical protein
VAFCAVASRIGAGRHESAATFSGIEVEVQRKVRDIKARGRDRNGSITNWSGHKNSKDRGRSTRSQRQTNERKTENTALWLIFCLIGQRTLLSLHLCKPCHFNPPDVDVLFASCWAGR